MEAIHNVLVSTRGMKKRSRRSWSGAPPAAAIEHREAASAMTVAVFDVSSNAARRQLGELCKDYGLTRFQKSAFEGSLSRNRREELFERGRRLLAQAPGGGRWAVFVVASPPSEVLRAVEQGSPPTGA